ncbi:MAG: hypothetical protein OXI46_03655 [Gemmatimonadota bacterium]|nr:hypothetical protein [Gemmatimonadota bacterium]
MSSHGLRAGAEDAAHGDNILHGKIRGEEDPRVLAELAHGSLRRKQDELAKVVTTACLAIGHYIAERALSQVA